MWWASQEFLKVHEAFEHLNMGKAFEWLFGPGSQGGGGIQSSQSPKVQMHARGEGLLMGALTGIYLQPA